MRLPAPAVAVKLSFPPRKSWSDKLSVEATSPATSTRLPAPNKMPLGLIRNTRPFDCNVPRMIEGSMPVTRFNTALEADCWTKLVISPTPIENPCQLMIEPGVLVIVSDLPLLLNEAWPLTTVGCTGLAHATSAAKHAAIMQVNALGSGWYCFLWPAERTGGLWRFFAINSPA